MKLKEAGLYLKLPKSEFEFEQISFVSFIFMLEGVEMEPDRVCTIDEWHETTCYCDIPVYHGFTDFYRRFMSSFLCEDIPPDTLADLISQGQV